MHCHFGGMTRQRTPRMAGEQGGFSVEDMIQILNAGISVETLLDLIDQAPERKLVAHPAGSFSRDTILPC
jgi:hypothetical protein